MQFFSKLLLLGICVPAVLLLALGFYFEAPNYAYCAIPLVLAAAVVFTMAPQLDWKYYTKYPPELDGPFVQILDQNFDFYHRLSSNEKTRFRNRSALYMMGVEYMGRGFEEVPYDIKAMIAAEVVRFTFGQKEFILLPYEVFAVYPHPFPSPVLHTLHPSETDHTDGVIVLSAPHVSHAFRQPEQFYNVALHEIAGAWLHKKQMKIIGLDENVWPFLEEISKFPNEVLQETMVFPLSQSYNQVAITYFLTFPKRFKQVLPELYQVISNTLNVDPLFPKQPSPELL